MSDISINLEKGQKIELTKTTPGLTKVQIGGGWDVNKNATGSYDVDISAYLVDVNEKIGSGDNIVYFNHKKNPNGSVELDKDNLTGEGEGDDEKIFINFDTIPADRAAIYFAINIYKAQEKRQNFGVIQNAYIRIVNMADNQQLMRFDLSEDYSTGTGVLAGKLYRHGTEWKFQAIGEVVNGDIATIAKRWQ